MKKTLKKYKELSMFLEALFADKKIKTYNIVANGTNVVLSWKEEIMEQGLNKIQREEVIEIVRKEVRREVSREVRKEVRKEVTVAFERQKEFLIDVFKLNGMKLPEEK